MLHLDRSFQNLQREVDAGMTRLNLLSDNPEIAKDVSFTQPKILLLWGEIVKSNFTEEERQSLKVFIFICLYGIVHLGS